MPGIERAPLKDFTAERPSEQGLDSIAIFSLIGVHCHLIEEYLGIGTEDPFVVDAEALALRRMHLEHSKETSYRTTRGLQEIALLLGATVGHLEEEMERASVLDIGCGDGRFAEKIGRSAKARVTLLERDKISLPVRTKGMNRQIVANGEALPFRDESFAKTISAFSAMAWADSPLSALTSLQEALRVTEVGGTHFAIPVMSQVLMRQSRAMFHMNQDAAPEDLGTLNDPRIYKVWALQDLLLLDTLLVLENKGLCSTTWTSLIGQGSSTGMEIESYSAIIDKNASIPQGVFDDQITFARSFFAEA